MQKIRQLGRDKRGLSTVEYTILLVLIVAGTVGAWNSFGKDLKAKLKDAQTEFGKVKKQ
jgi:Flp pilus assembly pilin Flp